MAGWIKMPLDTEVDLGPGHIVLGGVPAHRERGTAATLFSAHVYCGYGRPYQLLLSSCYIMKQKFCSRLLVLYCRNLYERRQILVFDPHFEEVRGGIEPWLMARWKVRVRLPIRHN